MLAPPEGLEQFQPAQKYLLIDQQRNLTATDPSNVLAILFRVMRSTTDADMRTALHVFAERMKAPDMRKARDSLMRWLQSTLREEFLETPMIMEEVPTMLFNKRFKKYEDLLEFEAIGRGRAEGLKEGRQEGREEGQRIALQQVLRSLLTKRGEDIPPQMTERIVAANAEQLNTWLDLLLGGAQPRQIFNDR